MNEEETQKLITDSLQKAVLIRHPSSEQPASIHTFDEQSFKVIGAVLEWEKIQGKYMVAPQKQGQRGSGQYGWEITDLDKFMETYGDRVGATTDIKPEGEKSLAEHVRVAMEIPYVLEREFSKIRQDDKPLY